MASNRHLGGMDHSCGEIYAVTGNRQWLHEALPIAERSIRRNVEVNYDSRYGLMRGTMVYSDGSLPTSLHG